MNTDLLEVNNEEHQFIFQKNMQLASFMKPKALNVSPELFDTLMFSLAWIPEFKPVTAFSENLDLLSDDPLKVLIANWTAELASYRKVAQIIYDLYYNYLYPSVSAVYPMKSIPSNNLLFRSATSEFKYDQDDILRDLNLENHVIMKSYNAGVISERANKLYELQNEIIVRIDAVLNE